MKTALDTNLLAYAEGLDGAERQAAAVDIIAGLHDPDIVLPAQVLGELFAVLTRKGRRSAEHARRSVLNWMDIYPVVETTAATLLDAMELAQAHRLSFWDSVILAAAAQAECRVLLSEDMHHGFIWRGVEIRNPFLRG